MNNTRKGRWVGGAIVAGLIVVALVGLSGRRQVPQVPVAMIERENLTATITSNGKVEPINAFVNRAQFATFVTKVFAIEGQAVRRGQSMLTLESADIQSKLAQARSDLLTAQADLRNARAGGPPDELAQIQGDLQKAQAEVTNLEHKQEALQQLLPQHAATQDELAQNQLALARARANLQTAQQKKDDLGRRAALDTDRAGLRVQQLSDEIRSLEEKVRSAFVTASANGTLYSLPVHVGDYVSVGQVLAEMADLSRVRVRAFVDEPDLGWLEPNQSVQITWDGMAGRIWAGRTEQVPKQVIALGTRSVGVVFCSVDNAKLELLPNVNVEVRIVVRERPGVLVVPRAAVRTDGPHHFVFALDGDRVRRREILVGIASSSRYEVLSGLIEGDRVVLPGDLDLRDGMEVHPKETT